MRMVLTTTAMCGIHFRSVSRAVTPSFVSVYLIVAALLFCIIVLSNLFKGPDMLWSFKYVPLGVEVVAIWWDGAAWQPSSNWRIQQWNKCGNCKHSVKSCTSHLAFSPWYQDDRCLQTSQAETGVQGLHVRNVLMIFSHLCVYTFVYKSVQLNFRSQFLHWDITGQQWWLQNSRFTTGLKSQWINLRSSVWKDKTSFSLDLCTEKIQPFRWNWSVGFSAARQKWIVGVLYDS